MTFRKESIWIGTWNIRSFLELGKLALIEKEFKRIKLDIIGLAETRWNKDGHFNNAEDNMIVSKLS